MTVPIFCLPSCCGCILGEDDFVRPDIGIISPIEDDAPLPWIQSPLGTWNTQNEQAFTETDNSYAICTYDLAGKQNYRIIVQIVPQDVNTETSILFDIIDSANCYFLKFTHHGGSTPTITLYRRINNIDTSVGSLNLVANASGYHFYTLISVDRVNNQILLFAGWVDPVALIVYDVVSASAVYSFIGNYTGIGAESIAGQGKVVVENFKIDECENPACIFCSDPFQRPNNPDVNVNAPVNWIVLSGDTPDLSANQMRYAAGKIGSIRPSLNTTDNKSCGAARFRIGVYSTQPGAVIYFEFQVTGTVRAILTIGNSIGSIPGKLEFIGDQSGPTNKPRIIEGPFYQNQYHNIRMCLGPDAGITPYIAANVSVNSNYALSIRTQGTVPSSGIWDFLITINIITNPGTIFFDTFESGNTSYIRPDCLPCDPAPCDRCEIILPDSSQSGNNQCDFDISSGFTNGITNTPGGISKIGGLMPLYGYYEIVMTFECLEGDQFRINFSLSGTYLLFTCVDVLTGLFCVKYYHEYALRQEGYASFIIGAPVIGNENYIFIYFMSSGLMVIVNSNTQYPTIVSDQVSRTGQSYFALQLDSFISCLVSRIKVSRAAAGSPTSVSSTDRNYCYSVPVGCEHVTMQRPFIQAEFPGTPAECSAYVTPESGYVFSCGGDPPTGSDGSGGCAPEGIHITTPNTWLHRWNKHVDYPIPNPSASFGPGSVIDLSCSANINDEVRISWDGGTSSWILKRLATDPDIGIAFCLPSAPVGYSISFWEVRGTGIGVPIKFASQHFGASGPNFTICIGEATLQLRAISPCNYTLRTFITSVSYSSSASPDWIIGSGALAPGNHVVFSDGIQHSWSTRPLNFHEYPPTPQVCRDCSVPRVAAATCASGVGLRYVKVTIAGISDNPAYGPPTCGGKCSSNNRIIVAPNRYNYDAHNFAIGVPWAMPYDACRNYTAEVSVQLMALDATQDQILVRIDPMGVFFQKIFPKGTVNFCTPFAPQVCLPSSQPGGATVPCLFTNATITVEGL